MEFSSIGLCSAPMTLTRLFEGLRAKLKAHPNKLKLVKGIEEANDKWQKAEAMTALCKHDKRSAKMNFRLEYKTHHACVTSAHPKAYSSCNHNLYVKHAVAKHVDKSFR